MGEIWSRKSKNLETIECVETYKMSNLQSWEDGICQRKEIEEQVRSVARQLKF